MGERQREIIVNGDNYIAFFFGDIEKRKIMNLVVVGGADDKCPVRIRLPDERDGIFQSLVPGVAVNSFCGSFINSKMRISG